MEGGRATGAKRKAESPSFRRASNKIATFYPSPLQTTRRGIEPPTLSSRAEVHDHWAKLVPASGRQRTLSKLYERNWARNRGSKPRFRCDVKAGAQRLFLGGGGVWVGTFATLRCCNPRRTLSEHLGHGNSSSQNRRKKKDPEHIFGTIYFHCNFPWLGRKNANM